jgi:hypothetical protein
MRLDGKSFETFFLSVALTILTILIVLNLPPISSLGSAGGNSSPISYFENLNRPPLQPNVSGLLLLKVQKLVSNNSTSSIPAPPPSQTAISNGTYRPVPGLTAKVWPGTSLGLNYLVVTTNSSGMANMTLSPGAFTLGVNDSGASLLLPFQITRGNATEVVLTVHASYYPLSFFEVSDLTGSGWVQPWEYIYANATGASEISGASVAYLSRTPLCVGSSAPCSGPPSSSMVQGTIASAFPEGGGEFISFSPGKPFLFETSSNEPLYLVNFGISSEVTTHGL